LRFAEAIASVTDVESDHSFLLFSTLTVAQFWLFCTVGGVNCISVDNVSKVFELQQSGVDRTFGIRKDLTRSNFLKGSGKSTTLCLIVVGNHEGITQLEGVDQWIDSRPVVCRDELGTKEDIFAVASHTKRDGCAFSSLFNHFQLSSNTSFRQERKDNEDENLAEHVDVEFGGGG
jgi:hypothetical protein